jgi:glycerol-3-phosphate dehydrogenase
MADLAMEARAEFVGTSPEQARALRFCFPIFKGGPYRGWQIDLAFKLLDRLGAGGVPLDYERVPAAAATRMPLLRWLRDPQALESVAMFREYQFDWPERICVDAVLDAERLGAVVRNYTRASIASRDADGWSIELAGADALAAEPDAQPVRVKAKVVLTMAGLWIDSVNRTAQPAARQRILGTKGLVKLPADCANIGIAAGQQAGTLLLHSVPGAITTSARPRPCTRATGSHPSPPKSARGWSAKRTGCCATRIAGSDVL